jgi:beta-1,4-mannosyltransferase
MIGKSSEALILSGVRFVRPADGTAAISREHKVLPVSPPIAGMSLRIGSWPGPSFRHNSMIAILCDALQRRGSKVVDVLNPWQIHPKEIDLLQIHWPEQVFWSGGGRLRKLSRVCLTLAALARLRLAGVRISWMVHNLQPHESGTLNLALWRFYVLGLKLFTQQYITLSPMTESVVRRHLRLSRHAAVTSVRHPCYPMGSSKEVARRTLGISSRARMYVFFGAVRPYKGIDGLLDAFEKLEDPNAILIIAGQSSSPSTTTMLAEKAELDPRINLRLGYVEENALSEIIDAADRVVLPFVSYLHSGSLIRALSQGKVTITPETPFARNLRDELGEQWVQLYQGRLTAKHLKMHADQQGGPDMSAYGPDQVAEQLLRCYGTITEANPV